MPVGRKSIVTPVVPVVKDLMDYLGDQLRSRLIVSAIEICYVCLCDGNTGVLEKDLLEHQEPGDHPNCHRHAGYNNQKNSDSRQGPHRRDSGGDEGPMEKNIGRSMGEITMNQIGRSKMPESRSPVASGMESSMPEQQR